MIDPSRQDAESSDSGAPASAYSLSVVSHGQSALVNLLLNDLEQLAPGDFELIVTLNIEEPPPRLGGWSFPVSLIRNSSPKGFGANHNAAYRRARGTLFVVVNPDIRCARLSLAELAKPFADARVGITAPVVVDSDGKVQDSARRFPTFASLLGRVLLNRRGSDYAWTTEPMSVDWLAGMMLMIRRSTFDDLSGFDDKRFFMYYEDVDLCRRARAAGWDVVLQPSTSVVHDAQRASHRDWKHFRWHLASTLRYLTGI